jgi:hypothetical protein
MLSMKSSEKFQAQSSTAKRAATMIDTLVKDAKYQAMFDASLTRLTSREVKQLESAAHILTKLGSKSKVIADAVARAEDIKAKAIEKAHQESEKIMARWPMSTTLDKTALIYVVRRESAFNNIGNNTTDDFLWGINYRFENALSTFQDRISYDSVVDCKQVDVLMAVAESRLAEIKTRPFVKEFAKKWDLVLEQQKHS